MPELNGSRVLVTGGAGFIGSELVRQLADAGAETTVLDSLVNGQREYIDSLGSDDVKLVVGDVRDASVLEKCIRGQQVVFHLAALGVRHSIYAPDENHDVNATGSLRVIQSCLEAGVQRYVHVSTSEIYGNARIVPMTEDHPVYPNTVYGGSKLAGEAYARAFHLTRGFPAVIIRPFNSYGPRAHHEGDSGMVIPKFLLRAMTNKPLVIFGDGEQKRDMTFVTDTARGILLGGAVEGVEGQTFNVGNGQEHSISELAQMVRSVTGADVEIVHEAPRPGDTRRLFADCSRAMKTLGYSPTVNLEEGLARLKDWFLSLDRSPEELAGEDILHNWMRPEQQETAR